MNASLIVSNLAAYSLQVAVLIIAGLLLMRVLRLVRPLLFLQLLLAAVLVLPLLQTWQRPVILAQRISPGRVAMPVMMLERADVRAPLDWAMLALIVIGLGVLARSVWLLLGLMRLRSIRWDANPIGGGVAVSPEVSGPVTFGFWRPIILLPPEVMELPEEAREAILAHERAHVRRRDWLFALAEEIVLCVLWFHPALWLLVARIRLTREQVVDREACCKAGSREVYVDALLAVADARIQPYLAPAPQFLRQRQLAARINALLMEVPMSRFRLIASYSAVAAFTVAAGLWVTASFPLRGAPQVAESVPDYVTAHGAALILVTPPAYPIMASRADVSGPVTIEVTLAANGEVADARVISGAPELRKAALAAVLNWQFKPGPSVAQVTIDFRKPQSAGQGIVKGVFVEESLPPAIYQTLHARLQPFVGRPVAPEIHSVVQSVSAGLRVRTEVNRQGETSIYVGAGLTQANPPSRIRVGGAVQAANILTKVDPEYPPLARQARIQGTVRFDAVIDKTGAVSNLMVVSGHPLLVPNATEAAKQFRYKPTLLNGQPVEVVTQVDVNFIL
ncbi:MAG: M56 family metallopeptidase [Acidobacteria bacterium]|nr:M56 family metallopeptidase [Acidobacteriota bacterium]